MQFFYAPADDYHYREARKICAGCEVRDECLEHAMSAPEKSGMWGGKSPRERRLMRSTDPSWLHSRVANTTL